MRSDAAVCLLVLSLVACDDPTGTLAGDVIFTAAQNRYAAGDTVEVMLHNRGDQTLVYDLCTPRLERAGFTGWTPVEVEYNRACRLGITTLDPGASAAAGVPLPRNAEEGAYRVTTQVSGRNLDLTVAATPRFAVDESTRLR